MAQGMVGYFIIIRTSFCAIFFINVNVTKKEIYSNQRYGTYYPWVSAQKLGHVGALAVEDYEGR